MIRTGRRPLRRMVSGSAGDVLASAKSYDGQSAHHLRGRIQIADAGAI